MRMVFETSRNGAGSLPRRLRRWNRGETGRSWRIPQKRAFCKETLALNSARAVAAHERVDFRFAHEIQVARDRVLQRGSGCGKFDRCLPVATAQEGVDQAGGERITRAHAIHDRDLVVPAEG